MSANDPEFSDILRPAVEDLPATPQQPFDIYRLFELRIHSHAEQDHASYTMLESLCNLVIQQMGYRVLRNPEESKEDDTSAETPIDPDRR